MTTAKLVEVLQFYDNHIYRTFPVPEGKQFADELYNELGVIPAEDILAHLRWMIGQCLNSFIPLGEHQDIYKAHRWLGYIQGELRALGIFTVNEMRAHSRSKSR